MDNVPSSPAFPEIGVIKLDQYQYTFYKKSRLEIRSPTGKMLSVMRKPLPGKTDEDVIYQLWCQACLLEVLFDELEGKIKLPKKALNGIAPIIDRIDLYLRKQLRL